MERDPHIRYIAPSERFIQFLDDNEFETVSKAKSSQQDSFRHI